MTSEVDTVKLIVGLGNPGPKHALDRHNVGFWFVDALIERFGGVFRSDRKFSGELARVEIDGKDLRLLKPSTYVNRSGLAVQAVVSYLKLTPEQVLVVYDELDLPPGTVRLKQGGGGSHNGLRDVIAHIGRDFYRLRIGIGHPGHRDDVIDYVLHRPGREEEDEIVDALADAIEVLPLFLGQGEQKAMHKLHSRGVTPKPYRKEGESEPDEGGGAGDSSSKHD